MPTLSKSEGNSSPSTAAKDTAAEGSRTTSRGKLQMYAWVAGWAGEGVRGRRGGGRGLGGGEEMGGHRERREGGSWYGCGCGCGAGRGTKRGRRCERQARSWSAAIPPSPEQRCITSVHGRGRERQREGEGGGGLRVQERKGQEGGDRDRDKERGKATTGVPAEVKRMSGGNLRFSAIYRYLMCPNP